MSRDRPIDACVERTTNRPLTPPPRHHHTGKTTLLNVLAGQVPASPNLDLTGRLYLNGRPVGGGKGGAEQHSQVHSHTCAQSTEERGGRKCIVVPFDGSNLTAHSINQPTRRTCGRTTSSSPS